jgi:hypothetical protein
LGFLRLQFALKLVFTGCLPPAEPAISVFLVPKCGVDDTSGVVDQRPHGEAPKCHNPADRTDSRLQVKPSVMALPKLKTLDATADALPPAGLYA